MPSPDIRRLHEVNGPAWYACVEAEERERLLAPQKTVTAPEPPVPHIHASPSDSKILGAKLDRLAAIFSAPVKPVYADDGRLIAGERDLSKLPELPEVEPEPAPKPKKKSRAARMAVSILDTVRDWVAPAFQVTGDRLDELQGRIEALEARLPLTYDGTWTAGMQSRAGTFITDRGSIWYVRETTTDRPGSSAAFQLACKAGKDAPR